MHHAATSPHSPVTLTAAPSPRARKPVGEPLTDKMLAALIAAVRDRGVSAVSREAFVSRVTLYRALSGAPVHATVRRSIEAAMSAHSAPTYAEPSSGLGVVRGECQHALCSAKEPAVAHRAESSVRPIVNPASDMECHSPSGAIYALGAEVTQVHVAPRSSLMHSIAPSPEQLITLRQHPAERLAAEAGVNPRTAMRAKAGEPVRGPYLRVLVEAAARLGATNNNPNPVRAAL